MHIDDAKSKKIQRIVLGVSIVITVAILIYVRRLMAKARPAVVYARRKARQTKMQEAKADAV
jgi:Na+-transporting methylmalonyl-CoA/oxaloacetate decarboxylase gamma subunit